MDVTVTFLKARSRSRMWLKIVSSLSRCLDDGSLATTSETLFFSSLELLFGRVSASVRGVLTGGCVGFGARLPDCEIVCVASNNSRLDAAKAPFLWRFR